MVTIEPSMDCSQPSLVHEELDRVDDDPRPVGCSIKHAMASERADVRDLSGSLRCVPASPASMTTHAHAPSNLGARRRHRHTSIAISDGWMSGFIMDSDWQRTSNAMHTSRRQVAPERVPTRRTARCTIGSRPNERTEQVRCDTAVIVRNEHWP